MIKGNFVSPFKRDTLLVMSFFDVGKTYTILDINHGAKDHSIIRLLADNGQKLWVPMENFIPVIKISLIPNNKDAGE